MPSRKYIINDLKEAIIPAYLSGKSSKVIANQFKNNYSKEKIICHNLKISELDVTANLTETLLHSLIKLQAEQHMLLVFL